MINKKLIPIILIFLVLLAPLIVADTIGEATITIKIHKSTPISISGNSTNQNITLEIINSAYPGNNKNYTFNITNGELDESYDYLFLLIENTTVQNIDYFEKYKTCEVEKGKFDTAWQFCQNQLDTQNVTSCKDSLGNCNLQNKEKDLTITSLKDDVLDLNEEQTKTKNQKWIFGIVAFILGIVAYAFKEGKIGNQVKDKQTEGFNPGLNS